MPKSPYKQVLIKSNKRDISDRITPFRFENTIEKDDLLELTIPNATIEDIDDDDLQEGKLIEFRFGYLQLKHSRVYVGRISNVMPTYGATITLKIHVTDFGPLLKKDESDKIWQNKKVSTIAKEIAAKGRLEIHHYRRLRAGTLGNVNLTLEHSDLAIENSTELDAEIRHSQFEIENSGNLVLDCAHSNLGVGQSNNILVDLQHSEIEINNLSKVIEADVNHSEVRLRKVAKDFELIDLNGNHSYFNINVENNADYSVRRRTSDRTAASHLAAT